ncbi:MAG: AmmeMemoRadiSam system protein B [Candidatus Limnocylindrales bacterium]
MSGQPRRPAVAGTFYPARPAQLAELVEELIAAVTRVSRPEGLATDEVLGLLVPHAGLVYSGATAALSWLLAGEIGPTTIVLAGTDHQARATGVGVWTGGPWRTPLGDVPVDDALAGAIAALGSPFEADDDAHRDEHSLEVQLPLLARTCTEARIVALAVSPRLANHNSAGASLGRLLAEKRAAGEKILLVASSDLAHYPPARICEEVDAQLIEPLLRLDPDGVWATENAILRAGRPGVVCGLCGIDPVRVALAALQVMGARGGFLLGEATSADAGADPRRTVGYAAAAFV